MGKKIALCADLHFGVQDRTDDILYGCNVVKKYCELNNISTVIILGDTFHNRESIAIDVANKAIRFFESCKESEQTWIALLGNHDMFLRHSWDINSLDPFKGSLKIINKVRILSINDRRFHILPFITFENSYMSVLAELSRHYEKGDVLLTHIGVADSILNSCFLLKDWGKVSFRHTPYEFVFTGHFHIHQKVGDKVIYPGSIIPFKFDEGDSDHGFLTFDLETSEVKFHDIVKLGREYFSDLVCPPKYMTVLSDLIDELTVDDVGGNLIRVALSSELTEDEKRVIKDKLLSLGTKSVRWMELFKQSENKIMTPDEFLRKKDLFKSWIDHDYKNNKGLDFDLLNNLHNEIVFIGDESYSLEVDDIDNL